MTLKGLCKGRLTVKRADLLFVCQADLEQADAEAQIICIFHLLPEQLLLAVPSQQSSVLSQAGLHLAAMRLHVCALRVCIRLQHDKIQRQFRSIET